MSPAYAFLSGAILIALAALRVGWFLWRGSATREARWFGVQAAGVLSFAAGGLLLLGGLCFWGWAAMILLDQNAPRSGPKAGQPPATPKPMTRPPESDYSLTESVELEPGYWVRPPRGFAAEPVAESEIDGQRRRAYCWRDPQDDRQFVVIIFRDDNAPCAFLSADAPGDSLVRGQFLVGQFHKLLQEFGGPALSSEGETHLANYDGLLTFGKRTRHSQMQYGAVYYAGCDDGRLVELLCCELGHSGLESSLRSMERRLETEKKVLQGKKSD